MWTTKIAENQVEETKKLLERKGFFLLCSDSDESVYIRISGPSPYPDYGTGQKVIIKDSGEITYGYAHLPYNIP